MKAVPEQADAIFAIEFEAFPTDEAADLQSVKMRMAEAGQFFHVLLRGNEVVGYINGTVCEGRVLRHESMSEHKPAGSTLVIHSVTVAAKHRRQGFATRMLKLYLQQMLQEQENAGIDYILLLAKAKLLEFYVSCGFSVLRVSPIVHGKDNWFELALDLGLSRCVEQLTVDAFSAERFHGNPAAVCFMAPRARAETEPSEAAAETDWMQRLAAENNLAETAFLQPRGAVDQWGLRWFTPTCEIDLCGHATLASAHALYETLRVPDRNTAIQFSTRSGVLVAQANTQNNRIQMKFPATAPAAFPEGEEAPARELFKAAFEDVGGGMADADIEYFGKSIYDVFVRVRPEKFYELATLVPSLDVLAKLGGRGVIMTTLGGREGAAYSSVEGRSQKYHFLSRCFFPCCGVPEDPVTGSAHCALAPHYFALYGGSDKVSVATELHGYQGTPRRGGEVTVGLSGASVLLSGPAITAIRSQLSV